MPFTKDQFKISSLLVVCLAFFSMSLFVPTQFIHATLLPGFFCLGILITTLFLKKQFSNLKFGVVFLFITLLFYFEYSFFKHEIIIAYAIKCLSYLAMGILITFSAVSKKLSLWIFSAMLIGVAVGLDFHDFSLELKRFGDVFIRLIKTLVAPLLFSTLVVGIAGHSNLKQVGRIGLKSIIYFEIVTTFALFIGLAAINISQAGKNVANVEVSKDLQDKSTNLLTQLEKPKDHFVDIFPENFAKAIVENQVLQIVVFSLIFAIALIMVKNLTHKHTMLNWMESLSEVMFKFTDIVMLFAPIAVFGSIAYTVANSGADVLANLLKLVITLYVALIAFVILVFLPIAYASKIPIKRFLHAVTEPLSIAFATASSEAALPKALENMEKFGISRKIVGFVIPTGYSFNLDGTTLYLSMATVFVAQMSGVDLTFWQQITICLTLMLTSKGVAGVRGASFVILTTTLIDYSHLGINYQLAGIILGVDALMDMARTSVNVLGNCLASAVIAKSEGEEFIPVLESNEITE